MNVTFNIDCNDMHSENKLKRLVNTDEAFDLIWDIDNKIRNHLKYGDEKNDVSILEEIRGDIAESNLNKYWV